MKELLERANRATVAAYEIKGAYLREHHGIEETVLAGGYGYRQVLELVQNGADAILEAGEAEEGAGPSGRVAVLIRGTRLYVANTGAPLSAEGLEALLTSHSSPKRGNQIGRFGLGFKSLLRLGGQVDFFGRRSLDFRFDPERCRRELQAKFQVESVPGLRLAWPLDRAEKDADEVLRGLDWAETVVRAEVAGDGTRSHLRQEIREFPGEFLLFFPAAVSLLLDDGESPPREVSVRRQGDFQILQEGDELSQWRVESCEARIVDPSARADATHLHARDSVPLSWAIPVEGRREEAGRFWAFFPTQTQTYIPGILNAPWKLNSDRNAVIGGEWNSALMREAAALIVESLRGLATPNDPGRPLDNFPRQLDRKDDPAELLVRCVWEGLQDAAVVADAEGDLRCGVELWRHPLDSAQLASSWRSLAEPEERQRLVHPACLAGQRASRLGALAVRLEERRRNVPTSICLQRRSQPDWFAAVASTDWPRALKVLRLAEEYSEQCRPVDWEPVRTQIAIIPTEQGKLARVPEVRLGPAGIEGYGPPGVAARVAEDPDAARILSEVLCVRGHDAKFWGQTLTGLLKQAREKRELANSGWASFWKILRLAPADTALPFLEHHGEEVHVRRRDQRWAPPSEALLPGGLVAEQDDRNRGLLIDFEMHGGDGERLARIGVREFPEGSCPISSFSHHLSDRGPLKAWLESSRSAYKREHDNQATWGYLAPSHFEMPSGYGLLSELKGVANARLTEWFLELVGHAELTRPVVIRHATVPRYPSFPVPHPFKGWLVENGMLMLGDAAVPLAAWLARLDEPALVELPETRARLAALRSLKEGSPPGAPTPSGLADFWRALVDAVADAPKLANGSLAPMLSRAAKDGYIPESLRIGGRRVSISEFSVSTSAELCERLHRRGRLVVALEAGSIGLWRRAGARDLGSTSRPVWSEAEGPALSVVEAIPELGAVLLPGIRESGRCQQVSGLRLSVDGDEEIAPCLMWEGTLFVDGKRLAAMPRSERLLRVAQEVGAAGWLKQSVQEAMETLWNGGVEERRRLVAAGASLPERLERAVGGRREPLLEALGEVAMLPEVTRCTAPELAQLTIAQLGPAVLLRLKASLEAEGLNPPERWNSPEARRFVAAIGFPEECASAARKRSAPELYVSGPIDLPPLHDFQEEVLEGITRLVNGGQSRRRAVVSLPTGGGKTRVTVEAAVKLVLVPSGTRRSVVWVAQTEELCEQAVQAFRQVWVNLGAEETELRIVRLWGGNPSPAMQGGMRPVVIVASIQTLNSRLRSGELDWLKDPGLVVVDECHHAITPSYTNLMRWLDSEPTELAGRKLTETPILGLSATPFRMDDVESHRLARRFDQTWLPANQEQLHDRLLGQGVLAEARYEVLETGAVLTADELRRLENLSDPWEGLDFERLLEAINQRLGRDPERNRRLVECIRKSEEASILLFANSVQHAEEMSALLNLGGVRSAAVSGDTPGVSRRHFLERFKAGDIRVLCNHTVLSTGFDAPRTDMILIARQVFSPVRYMQMVGRGLRGEKNGGTPNCRIVTALDNLGRFATRHAYHYCRNYFTKSGAGELFAGGGLP